MCFVGLQKKDPKTKRHKFKFIDEILSLFFCKNLHYVI